MVQLQPTACMLVIGNEILSGRTQDKNLNWLAGKLTERGIRLAEARVIPDVAKVIIATVNEVRARYDYVFTSGGIGPTHDDITAECIARAFGVKLHRDAEAKRRLEAHYTPDMLNEARLKMADVPEGAALIDNPVSAAPGFRVENVYVMAGVPSIMQAMFESIAPTLNGGPPTLSVTVSAFVTEGTIAEELTAIQKRFADIEIGSYPFIQQGKLGTSLVARGADAARLAEVKRELEVLFKKAGN